MSAGLFDTQRASKNSSSSSQLVSRSINHSHIVSLIIVPVSFCLFYHVVVETLRDSRVVEASAPLNNRKAKGGTAASSSETRSVDLLLSQFSRHEPVGGDARC